MGAKVAAAVFEANVAGVVGVAEDLVDRGIGYLDAADSASPDREQSPRFAGDPGDHLGSAAGQKLIPHPTHEIEAIRILI